MGQRLQLVFLSTGVVMRKFCQSLGYKADRMQLFCKKACVFVKQIARSGNLSTL